MNEHLVYDYIDPLSAALTKMKLRAFTSVALNAGGQWAVDFPDYEGFTLNVVQKGECWLSIKHGSQKVRLRAGDCFLLTGGREFTLTTDLSLQTRFRAAELFPQAEQGTACCNGGGDFFVLGIIFRFQGPLSSVLWNRLPAIVHVDSSSDHAPCCVEVWIASAPRCALAVWDLLLLREQKPTIRPQHVAQGQKSFRPDEAGVRRWCSGVDQASVPK